MPKVMNMICLILAGFQFIRNIRVNFYLWKMTVSSIITNWENKEFKPIYWLEGEEEYFIDELIEYAEKKILSPSEAEFNQTVFYGKDANCFDIINACRW